jgi:hypothetical protein
LNWNWLTGAEVFRILAALPCTFMMLMCLKRADCWSALRNRPTDGDYPAASKLKVRL